MKLLKEWGRTVVSIAVCAVLVLAGCFQLQSQLAVWDTIEDSLEESMPDQFLMKKNGVQLLPDVKPSIKSVSPDAKFGPGAKVFQGGRMTMLANQSASQMMSFILESKGGSMIVVDGGTPDDAGHLADTLRAKGGHVRAWFITHPHSDHVGALTEILNNPDSGITIDNIYYSFTDLDWYHQNEEYRADMVEKAVQALQTLPADKLHGDIVKGQVITVDDVTVTVMNLPYLYEHNSINNSSVAYKVLMDGKTILFLGDLGAEAGNQLLADCGAEALKADVVQMAHHGQYGVTKEVYEAIRPEICMWPTPGWLWDNDNGGGPGSGPWFTHETIQWVRELGVVSNYCIKDGDQIVE